MASTDAQPFPIKNKAYRETVPIFTSAGALVTSGTMAVTISKDGAAFGNPSAGATNATQISTSSGLWYFDLSATDMNCDTLAIKVSDGTNPPTVLVIKPIEIKELSAVPGFSDGTNGLEELLSFLLAMHRNKKTQTNSASTLLKDDGTTTLAASSVSDNGSGTTTFGEWA